MNSDINDDSLVHIGMGHIGHKHITGSIECHYIDRVMARQKN